MKNAGAALGTLAIWGSVALMTFSPIAAAAELPFVAFWAAAATMFTWVCGNENGE